MAQVIIFTDTSRPGLWLRGIGPYSLMSYVRSKGYTAEIIDFVSAIAFDDFCKLVDKHCDENTLFVGISTTWISAPKFTTDLKKSFGDGDRVEESFYNKETHNAYFESLSYALSNKTHKRFTDKIRASAPNAILGLGGARAIDFMCDDFDKCVLGYSENQIIDLLEGNRILGSIVNHDIKGELGNYNFGDNITTYEESDLILPDETLPIEIGRGCIFACKYCSFPLIGKKKLSYMKDPELLRSEFLFNWENYGVRRYIISDDTFNDSIEKLEMLADIADNLPFRLQFWCFARLDLITVKPQMIELFQRIGIKEVQFGIESFHPPTAKVIGKGMGPDIKKETLYKVKEAWGDDIFVKCSFIIGLPYETTETIREHYEWLASDDCPIDHVGINPLFLQQPDGLNEYRWNSYFDKHFGDYGYYFENPRNGFDWKKKDDTDITSFEQCYELFKYWMKEIDQNKHSTTESFYLANTKELGHTFDELMYGKLNEAKLNNDWKKMYIDQVNNLYLPRKLK
jgi:hypothetical protein